MKTGKRLGEVTVSHNGQAFECSWTLHEDQSFTVGVRISETHFAHQRLLALPPETDLNAAARRVANRIVATERSG